MSLAISDSTISPLRVLNPKQRNRKYLAELKEEKGKASLKEGSSLSKAIWFSYCVQLLVVVVVLLMPSVTTATVAFLLACSFDEYTSLVICC
ncbi:hypothetical protein M0804_007759 [Polistes exclamans]|nr:hypothetical protein M0804_007759 [Polistes exclamans]